MQDQLKYYVNEEKKTVICVAEDCEYDLLEELCPKFSSFSLNDKHIVSQSISSEAVDLFIDNKFTGKAKCDDSDIFDIEKGKTIARNKMRMKYNLAKLKKLISLRNSLDDISNCLEDNISFYINKIEHHEEIITQYQEEKI